MKHLFSLFFLLSISIAAATPESSLELPKQFQSDNAATVLGLESLESVDLAVVKKAAQRLWSKYHPDRVSGTSAGAVAQRAMYTAISQKIQAARDTLSKYLELNPNYNPSKDGSAASTGSRSGARSGGAARAYSWDDLFRDVNPGEPSSKGSGGFGEPSSSRSVVTESYFGTSLRGTMFEFLHQYPNVEIAVMPLEGRSPKVSFDVDYLVVLKPSLFPQVEIRVLSKPTSGAEPTLVETIYGTYKRGHDVSNQGGLGRFTDAIVFSDGTYLRPAFLSGAPDQPFHVVDLEAQGRGVLLATQSLFFFNEMSRDGFATGTHFKMSKREPLAILPATQTPAWKKVQLLEGGAVIRLGYDPGVKTCEGLFK